MTDRMAAFSFFNGLETPIIERLAARTSEITLQRGQALTRIAQPVHALYLIESGALYLSMHNVQGKRHVLRSVNAGNIYGLVPLIEEAGAVHDADAYRDTCLLQIPRAEFMAEMTIQPALAMRVVKLLCAHSRMLNVLVAQQQLLSLDLRVAHRILTLIHAARHPGKRDFPTHLELSQADMSDMLGVTRQSFNSALKRLESMELIEVAHMQITVIDLAKLRDYVASGGV